MIKVLSEVRRKLQKDFSNMESIKANGRYLTSNRYCESIFGHLKNREETSVRASLEVTIMLTVAKMNDLNGYLKKMTNSAKEKLWKKIDDKTVLQTYRRNRENLKKELREQANTVKDTKRAKKMKTADNKRKREEKKKITAKKPKKIKIQS
jgi:hypothetical protein